MLEWTSDSSTRQWSHKALGALEWDIFYSKPFLSSRIDPLAALDHGVYGSVILTCEPACQHLHLNSPSVCSLDPSIIIMAGTPSLAWRVESASDASDFFLMGCALVQPSAVQNTCAYLLPLLETTLDSIVSVNMSIGNL